MVPDNINITFEIIVMYANGDSVNAASCFTGVERSYRDRDKAGKQFDSLVQSIPTLTSQLTTHKIIQLKIVQVEQRQTELHKKWFERPISKKELIVLLEQPVVLERGYYTQVKEIVEDTVKLTNGEIYNLGCAKICGDSLGLFYKGETTWFNVYRQVKPHINGICEIIQRKN